LLMSFLVPVVYIGTKKNIKKHNNKKDRHMWGPVTVCPQNKTMVCHAGRCMGSCSIAILAVLDKFCKNPSIQFQYFSTNLPKSHWYSSISGLTCQKAIGIHLVAYLRYQPLWFWPHNHPYDYLCVCHWRLSGKRGLSPHFRNGSTLPCLRWFDRGWHSLLWERKQSLDAENLGFVAVCHGARSEPRKALVEQSYSTYTKLREEERNGENYS
jgi:hypothetical protein